LKVTELPLPKNLIKLLSSQGFRELYPPQEEAILAKVLEGKNLLLTTPTASGKTLIAILTAVKTIIERGGKVVYLTPLKALAQEKYEEFKSFEVLDKLGGRNIRVMITTGDYDSPSDHLNFGDIIILTNEKFDSLLRHDISWINDVKLFVVDEVHLIGDVHRGPTLEIILTKIKSMLPKAQLLALSATIRNSNELEKWLNSKLVDKEWRPIKLIEGVYSHGEIHFSDNTNRKIDSSNRGSVIDVAVDTVKEKGQSLIFTETRRRSVALANKASELATKFLNETEKRLTGELAKKILSIGELTELNRKLALFIEKGAAFHHAGLGNQHRRVVEEGFRDGLIKILVATPTLAAGVNLPARRVVLSSLFRYDVEFGGQLPISILDYKQMCGRAGRPKYDNIGETVLLAQNIEEADEIYSHYIKGKPEKIRSQLARNGPLRTHILATVASLPGLSITEIKSLFSKTLFGKQYSRATVEIKTQKTLDYLMSELLIEKRGERLLATEFGKRIAMLYIDPLTGILFRSTITYAEEKGSQFAGILHLISSTPDFTPKLFLRKSNLDDAEQFLEVHRDEFVVPFPLQSDYEEYEDFISNFRIIMALWGWIEEFSEEKIRELYGVEPGDLNRAVENSDWLLYALSEVCKIIGKPFFLNDIDLLRRRVKYGVKSELITLTTLDGVGRKRARSLFISGYRDLRQLRKAPLDRIARVEKIGFTLAKKIKSQLE
jgi:helicase